VSQRDTGHVFLKAKTLAYGRVMQDSVAFTIGYSIRPLVQLSLVMIAGVLTLIFGAPRKLILGVGAVVTFCNHSTRESDMVFNGPAAPDTASCRFNTAQFGDNVYAGPTGSGNIPAFGGVYQVNGPGDTVETAPGDTANCAARTFLVPGIYTYHSTLFPSITDTIEIRRD
jgi:hypothetical protein